MEFFGIKLVGMNADSGRKLLLTIALILLVLLLRSLFRALTRLLMRGNEHKRARFWTHQGISLFAAVVTILGVLSIWFEDPAQLTTALGLVTAGLAFALQKVITAVAGVKDAISRDLLTALDEAGIGIASATFDIVGLPPVRLELEDGLRRALQSRDSRAS